MVAPWLTNTFKPFDFSNITSYPHDLPSSLQKLSSFHCHNVIGAREHWDAMFMEHITILGVCHLDVLYKCFVLSLKKDARK
jgi:hypothetical protein